MANTLQAELSNATYSLENFLAKTRLNGCILDREEWVMTMQSSPVICLFRNFAISDAFTIMVANVAILSVHLLWYSSEWLVRSLLSLCSSPHDSSLSTL